MSPVKDWHVSTVWPAGAPPWAPPWWMSSTIALAPAACSAPICALAVAASSRKSTSATPVGVTRLGVSLRTSPTKPTLMPLAKVLMP